MDYYVRRNILRGLGCTFLLLIVAAILFPIFAKVNADKRYPSCLSNEKQIGIAIIAYCQDNDEMMPNIAAANNPRNTWRTHSCRTLPPISNR